MYLHSKSCRNLISYVRDNLVFLRSLKSSFFITPNYHEKKTIYVHSLKRKCMLNVSSRRLYHIYTASIIAALGIAMISISNLNSSPSAAFAAEEEQQHKFTAKMTGGEEVLPKNTKATGTAEFILSPDDKTLSYKISVKDIHSVTTANIHNGAKGENGPAVATLFRSRTGNPLLGFLSQNIPINGVLSEGAITSSNLHGPLKGKQVSDLANIIKAGQAYANVRTKQNPKGEIRGQIS
jgi:CHRD domain